ncbi:MAG: heavy metal-associated domain-containing protein [Rheinheimera sp.]|nr:heavy metal-associated domain-containing protein [Rheinheimera sp.]
MTTVVQAFVMPALMCSASNKAFGISGMSCTSCARRVERNCYEGANAEVKGGHSEFRRLHRQPGLRPRVDVAKLSTLNTTLPDILLTQSVPEPTSAISAELSQSSAQA